MTDTNRTYWIGGILIVVLLLTWHNIGQNTGRIRALEEERYQRVAELEEELEAARTWIAMLEETP